MCDKETDIQPLYRTAGTYDYALLKDFARSMRHSPTAEESVLWRYLRNNQLGYKFRRQHVVGHYIADFLCLDKKLIVELDGKYHTLPGQIEDDVTRQHWLEENGYTILRITNEELLVSTDNAIQKIKDKLLTL